jgi:hypothetical protein
MQLAVPSASVFLPIARVCCSQVMFVGRIPRKESMQ